MKFIAALALIGMTSTPAFAGHVYGQKNVHYEEKCYKNVERYIPGYYDDFGNWKVGRVKTTRKRVPCFRSYRRFYKKIEIFDFSKIFGHIWS